MSEEPSVINPEAISRWVAQFGRDVPPGDTLDLVPVDYSPRVETTMLRRGWGALCTVATNIMGLTDAQPAEWAAVLAGEATADQLTVLRMNAAYDNHTEPLEQLRGFDVEYWRPVVDDLSDLGARWLRNWGPVDVPVWERAAREATQALVNDQQRPSVIAWHDAWWPAQTAGWARRGRSQPMKYKVTREHGLTPILGMAVIVGALVGVLPQREEVTRAVLDLINQTAAYVKLG